MPHFSVLTILVGVPGAGKTTWAKKYLQDHPTTFYISTDDIRKELTGDEQCDPADIGWIHEEAKQRVKKIIQNPKYYEGNYGMGPEIIVDATNTLFMEWLDYGKLGASVMIARVFDIDPEDAIKRQQFRERRVPPDIIYNKHEELIKSKEFLPHIFNMVINM